MHDIRILRRAAALLNTQPTQITIVNNQAFARTECASHEYFWTGERWTETGLAA